MSRSVYQVMPLTNASFFQRLFKQFPQQNAVIELNNLLATKAINEITTTDVEAIENRYKLKLGKEYKLNLEEFYAVYLNHCLADKILSEEEINELSNLKNLLRLDHKTIERLHEKIGGIIYQKTFQQAVADGRLTRDEEAFLDRLEKTVRLPPNLANKISAEVRTSFVQNYLDRILADQRLSPLEEEELKTIADSLNVSISFNDQTREQFRKLKLYWALENLDLPAIQPDITIQKSEICHMKVTNVNWYEVRSVRQRVSYNGHSSSFKVAKGFYLRSGSYAPKSYSQDVMKLIDTGNLYLTNKRILFIGTNKNSNIRIDKILDFTPFVDGVEIGKDAGKSPTLQMSHNADIFCIILERLLNDR